MARKKSEKVDNRLLAFLERQNPEELIYLGTKEGSNWIMIDTAANVIQSIDSANTTLYIESYKNYEKHKTEVLRLPKTIVEIQEKLANPSPDDDIAKLNTKLENQVCKLVSAYNNRNRLSKIVENWTPLKEREVIETFPHTTDYPGLSIRIKGRENGKFWTKDEYDRVK